MSRQYSIYYTPEMEALQKELVSSPEKALAFLVRAGILMPDGELAPPYRQPSDLPSNQDA